MSLTDASSQGPPEQLPSMAKGSTGAGGCIDASDIVDALVSGADRDGCPVSAQLVAPLVLQTLSPSRDKLRSAVGDLEQVLVKVLVARAAEPLVAVRAVTSKYRMTNTPAPTAPSLYVRGVSQPLRAATSDVPAASSRNAGAGYLTHVSAEVRAEVLGRVISGVASKYTELVVEVFANVKRLGQTLKKLQKGVASAGDGGMSDDEKIYLQVYLDVEAVAAELKELAHDADSNVALCGLLEKVRGVCKEHSLVLPSAVSQI